MIWKEIASLKVNCGPPLSPTYSCPSRLKLMVMTPPWGPGVSGPYRVFPRIFESGNTET